MRATAKIWLDPNTGDPKVISELPDKIDPDLPDYRYFPLSYIREWPDEWLRYPIVKGIVLL